MTSLLSTVLLNTVFAEKQVQKRDLVFKTNNGKWMHQFITIRLIYFLFLSHLAFYEIQFTAFQ